MPEIEHILNLRNYDATQWFLDLIAQTSKCPRRFWELDPEILHVFTVPLSRLSRMNGVFIFIIFSPKMWGLLRPKYPQKMQKPKYLTKKQENK